jgi:hypothetical protein
MKLKGERCNLIFFSSNRLSSFRQKNRTTRKKIVQANSYTLHVPRTLNDIAENRDANVQMWCCNIQVEVLQCGRILFASCLIMYSRISESEEHLRAFHICVSLSRFFSRIFVAQFCSIVSQGNCWSALLQQCNVIVSCLVYKFCLWYSCVCC